MTLKPSTYSIPSAPLRYTNNSNPTSTNNSSMSTLDSTLSNSEVTSVNEQGLDVVAVVDPIEAEPTTFSTEENPIFTTFVAEANDGSVTPTQGVDATINLPDVMATATVTSNPTDNSANVAPVNGATPTQGIDATINLPAPNGMTTSMPAIHVANVESVALSSPVVEGSPSVFSVSLNNPCDVPTTVQLQLASDTATLGADFSNALEVSFDGKTWQSISNGNVIVPTGGSHFYARVPTIDDTLVEGTEKYTLTASANGSVASANGIITDNDVAAPLTPTATIGSISNATVTEGEKAVFQVTLANPNTAPTTVQFTPGAGSATPGADFTPDLEVSYDNGQTWSAVNPNGATNVPGGTGQFLVRHSTIDDTSVEPLENYTLTASANGTSQTGTGKIKDNDVLLPTAKIGSITNATVTEGQAAVFNVSLTDVNGAPSSVKLNLSDINATLGADYGGVEVSFDGQTWQSLTGDTVNLAGDATGFQVRVATNDDTLVEGTEKFTLTASTNGSTGTGTGTLLDNDKLAPTAKLVGTTSLIEGDRGSYQIQLDQVSDKDRIFTIQIDDGSAKRYDGNGSGQDIMSGGAYDYASIGKVIVGRVSNGTFSYSDRAMVGVGDASWDYTVKNSQGQINTGNTIQVKVAAGQTTSEAFSVQSWKEKVTVDRDYRGPQYTGSAVEGTENFSLKVVDGGDTTVTQGTVNVSIKDATKYNYISPIAIDLNGDGVQTVSVNDGVTFDILNIGQRVATGWISGDDGFLAVDNNGNGSIDNRDELFGGGVGEGFAKLDSFDSNRDGVVDEKDTDWQKLKIWQDKNVNGVTDAGELNNLSSYGIASLNVAHTNDFSKDAQGNILGERSTAIGTNGQSMDMIDVYFKLG